MINPMTKFVREDIKEFKVHTLSFPMINPRTRDASSAAFKIDMKSWSHDMHRNQNREKQQRSATMLFNYILHA